MRAAYVLKRYPRYSETFIVNEILAHEAAGLEVEIFALRPPTDTHFQDAISRVRAPVTYIPYSGVRAPDFWRTIDRVADGLPDIFTDLGHAKGEEGRDVYQAVELARIVRERELDHIHAHFGTSAAAVARMAARFSGTSYTFTAHAKDIFHESVVHKDLARKLREAATVVTVSDYNLDYLKKEYGDDARSVVRLYNGLDLEKFFYERSSGPAGTPHIVAVGRMVEKKGFSDLLDAAAILKERGVRFQCSIVGSGELESELLAHRARLGLEDVVRMPGPLPQREVMALLRGASVFAAPCIVGEDGNRDGLPTVLLEAMSLGTPCISTDVTGIPEVVKDGETGEIVPRHDPAALARSIERFVSDVGLRERYARNARKLIERDFDIEKNAAILRRVFESASEAAEEQT
ncbi:glycosyltransferase family 4 protein [Rubrobacter indicoceani]|uniref:glycosyltransferase family 4 protein n=1 Tax=Rubrobacter indicoceani TaxID=2051957 RepID=UPI000E5C23EA|nr:glycosyltransferase family 4 protein [Rubrobacter indicoceani]